MANPETTEFYTVVYRVEGDKAKHDEWWQSVQPLFMADDQPISVTAVSKADEVTRMNCIEMVAERHSGDRYDMIEEIRELIVHPDPLAWWKENHDEPE